jgi:ERF superfamily
MKTQPQELALAQPNGGAVARIAPTPAEMMQAMIEKGVTQENVAAFKELVILSEHMEDRNAQRAFNAAFVALQAELPTIVAQTVIPNRGKYEKFEDIMKVLQPFLDKHGFSVSFSMDFRDNRILETCILRHVGGHSQSNSFAVRTRKADTETQADCMAATTAKRNALCNALNIVIRQDCLNSEDDAGIVGDVDTKITEEQAFELERRCHDSESNVPAFLKFAQADSFKDIMASKYSELDALLSRKEKRGR